MNSYIIILPTHSSYLDICKLFCELLKKNWPDSEVVISLTGENICVDNMNVVYNGASASLTDCVVNVANRYEKDYYFCFLGDQFITKKIDNNSLSLLLDTLTQMCSEYCCLIPRNARIGTKKNGIVRNIWNNDIYCHSFAAFVATKKYIDKYLTDTTDLDYESFYLKKIYDRPTYTYKHDYILNKNIFGIIQGIQKGRWNRGARSYLVRKGIKISDDRKVNSLGESIYNAIVMLCQFLLPMKIRRSIKRKFPKRFHTDF